METISSDQFISSNLEAIQVTVELAERRVALTEYHIQVQVGQVEFSVNKRYKEFDSFDSTLKTLFPR
jgi:hypothetical protein